MTDANHFPGVAQGSPDALRIELDSCRAAVATIEANRTFSTTQNHNYAFYKGKVAGLEFALAAQPPAAPVDIETRSSATSGTFVVTEGEPMTPAAPVETCSRCGGSGLALNNHGEPDECRECRGNTVVCRSSAETVELAACFEADMLRGYSPIRNFTPKERRLIAAALRAYAPVTNVTDDMVEHAWAAIVGKDVAPICHQASVVRGDIRTALESFAIHLPGEPQRAPARDPMVAAVASLAAAISLLERTPKSKKAAPSDKMFDQMLADYRKALANARDALSRPEHHPTPSVADASAHDRSRHE